MILSRSCSSVREVVPSFSIVVKVTHSCRSSCCGVVFVDRALHASAIMSNSAKFGGRSVSDKPNQMTSWSARPVPLTLCRGRGRCGGSTRESVLVVMSPSNTSVVNLWNVVNELAEVFGAMDFWGFLTLVCWTVLPAAFT